MSVLHIVNQSPSTSTTLCQCLARLYEKDSLLLIEDGVYAVWGGCESAFLLANHQVYVLEADLTARGLNREQCLAGVTWVDYNDFVTLTVEHSQVLSWN